MLAPAQRPETEWVQLVSAEIDLPAPLPDRVAMAPLTRAAPTARA
ncbi:hypothetical protein SCNRRL3882_3793 [Streptomyces chartreusis NRRL 3882]|uniref:Uncharacterized protein n=1 Tax=Streptomyces chartreusis NRRL 3882 TaxID=1079985 RepID=A0A2N9BAF1_STRCX|nr:hypothetical protein SCNRRL3882_3793 [Streptomyces chartreusis NRRL 3882]